MTDMYPFYRTPSKEGTYQYDGGFFEKKEGVLFQNIIDKL